MKKTLDSLSISKLWIKCVALCFVFCSYFLSAQAENADSLTVIQYVHEDVAFQPVAILVNDEINAGHPGLYFDENGSISPELRQYISPQLTGDHEIVTMDVSEERIILFLRHNDQKFVRIAQWDSALNQYNIVDTDLIPSSSELDTYHDGNAVLLCIPSMDLDTEEIREDEWLFLTFQPIDDRWYLTSFTDGQSFVATLNDQMYLFDDYYEPAPASTWTIQGPVQFDRFSASSVWAYIQQYDEARPNCLKAFE